jgi:ligand-binding SRPBCC domain-containing protein
VKQYELTRRQPLSRPLRRIFPFFERPEHLALITPPSLGFKLLSPSPVEMKLGQIIDYHIHLFGVPVHWRSLISVYEPPYRFVDEQLIGPYGYWRHVHEFKPEGAMTHIIDKVSYRLPHHLPEALQSMVNRLYVAPYLQRIFMYRQCIFGEIFD